MIVWISVLQTELFSQCIGLWSTPKKDGIEKNQINRECTSVYYIESIIIQRIFILAANVKPVMVKYIYENVEWVSILYLFIITCDICPEKHINHK